MIAQIDITEYLLEATQEINKEFEELDKKIAAVRSDRTWAVAASQMRRANGAISGICWVVNSLKECPTCEVLQDMLEKWEEKIESKRDILLIMKTAYWKKAEEIEGGESK